MSDPAHDPDARATPAPTPPTATYDATPLAGPTVPYGAVAAPDGPPPVDEPRPARRRGLVIGGVAAAALLVLGLTFGGGVVLGSHLGPVGSQTAVEQGGFPGGDRPAPRDGFGPGGGDQGFPGQGDEGSGDGSEQGSTSDGDTTS